MWSQNADPCPETHHDVYKQIIKIVLPVMAEHNPNNKKSKEFGKSRVATPHSRE